MNPSNEKCCKCTREARKGSIQADGSTIWFCTFHWNRIIRNTRIQRKLAASKTKP